MTGPAGTPRSALAPVQRALYTKLTADKALMGLVSGVFDHVPEDAAWPYVVIGEGVESPDNDHTSFGRAVLATLHVWSEYKGFTEAERVQARLVELLDHQHRDLPVDGHKVVAVRYAQTLPLRDPNPMLRHVLVQFRIHTQQRDEP